MGNITLSDVAVSWLSLSSHLLDYFVQGNTTTVAGNSLAGSIADILNNLAQLVAILSTLLT
jgi:hypothetical protein